MRICTKIEVTTSRRRLDDAVSVKYDRLELTRQVRGQMTRGQHAVFIVAAVATTAVSPVSAQSVAPTLVRCATGLCSL